MRLLPSLSEATKQPHRLVPEVGPPGRTTSATADYPALRNQQLPSHTRACRLSRGPRLLRTVVQHDLSELMPGTSLEVVRWGNLEAEAGSA